MAGHSKRMATGGTTPAEAALSAWAANRALAEEIRRSIDELNGEERELRRAAEKLRQRLAMRRAERALVALGCDVDSPTVIAAAGDATDMFARETESRCKRVGVVPRSYIRPRASFFHGIPGTTTRPKKRGRPPKDYRTRIPSEPRTNVDALFLRAQSHEAFAATPARTFSAKERAIVRSFALEHMAQADPEGRLPLAVWNAITHVTKPAIQRSGFACKIHWELEEHPGRRVGPWTKDEDRVLRDLATGRVDPAIVNNWTEIARRMPIPGRPPVHCLIRYQTKLCTSNLNDKFTPDEDALIREAVEVFGERWTIIADLMDGRIAEQIRHRWQLSLSPNVKLGKFTVTEDRRLLLALAAYQEVGEFFQRDSVAWHQICHHLPGRPPPPVRDRFVNSLNPEVTFRPWSAEEDRVIRSTVEHLGFDAQGLWPRLAADLGNRTDNQVARRARFLMPAGYKAHLNAKRNGQDEVLPSIFHRPLADKQARKRRAGKQSSYQNDEEPAPSVTDDSSDGVLSVLL